MQYLETKLQEKDMAISNLKLELQQITTIIHANQESSAKDEVRLYLYYDLFTVRQYTFFGKLWSVIENQGSGNKTQAIRSIKDAS